MGCPAFLRTGLSYAVLGAQAASLFFTLVSAVFKAIAYLPVALLTIAIRAVAHNHAADGRAVFYEGWVVHSRTTPAKNRFRRAPDRMTLRSEADAGERTLPPPRSLSLFAFRPPPCLRYPVRMAVVDLDQPPSWWKQAPAVQAGEWLDAGDARRLAGTSGPVQVRGGGGGGHWAAAAAPAPPGKPAACARVLPDLCLPACRVQTGL